MPSLLPGASIGPVFWTRKCVLSHSLPCGITRPPSGPSRHRAAAHFFALQEGDADDRKDANAVRVHHRTLQLDRTSVAEGKCVSVRVDLGGRRIINKKTTTK